MRVKKLLYRIVLSCMCSMLLAGSPVMADEQSAEENASNPLAKSKNSDLRWQYLEKESGRVNDFFIEGAFMAHEKMKIKYELHYWETDTTGTSENDWESVLLKGIYFPAEGAWNKLRYRIALGMDWIVDVGDLDKGIGSGVDQIAPFGGVALGTQWGMTLIPLVQQFLNYSGEDVNSTAFRLIALSPLPEQLWIKLDAKVSVDWEHDQAVPINFELQLGKNINKNIALYVDGLVGVGGDRPYNWGVGSGLRFKY